ncbi:hypothetical protein BO94DRAFT_591584, partial [Aspergillus sclerotioniger CBS 115572]
MRTQRSVVWLGTFVLVSLFLICFRGSNPSPAVNVFPSPDPRPSAIFQRPAIPPNAQLIEQTTNRKVAQPDGFILLHRLSRMLSSIPIGYWHANRKTLARLGVQLIDEYDTIYHALLPFWALEPKTIRERARETLGFDNSMIGILIRNGSVSLAEGGAYEQSWQRSATVKMIKTFVEYLPDMDLVFNALDEPRVIVPNEDLQRLVAIAKDRISQDT